MPLCSAMLCIHLSPVQSKSSLTFSFTSYPRATLHAFTPLSSRCRLTISSYSFSTATQKRYSQPSANVLNNRGCCYLPSHITFNSVGILGRSVHCKPVKENWHNTSGNSRYGGSLFCWLVLLAAGAACTGSGSHCTGSGSMDMAGSIFPGELATTQQYLFGTPFIYRNIYSLNKGIYFLYVAIAVILLLYILVAIYLRKRNIKEWVSKLGGLSRNQIFLAVSLPLFLILTFLLAENAHDLIERGLTFMVLVVSCLIASVVAKPHNFNLSRRLLNSGVLVLVIFLTLTFPTVAYSIDAYTSFPESEEAGSKFLASNVSLDEKTLDMNSAYQLVLYAPYITPAKLSWYGQDASVYALRSTGYYKAAIRYDLSFDNNRFTQCLDAVKVNSEYDKIYSSPSTEIYLRNFVN